MSIVVDACHGLEYAHRAGVVHRDVKPGNLLIAGETSATKLADFGIAKAAEQTRITQVGSVLGTAAYLSPEQARGDEAGPASDIYSLGVCAYQFLTGRLPHEYSSLTELALKQQNDQVEPITVHRPEVPPELDRAIRVCLEREPGDRYASTLEMARSLEAGLEGNDTEATIRLAAGGAAPRRGGHAGAEPGDLSDPGDAFTRRTRRPSPSGGLPAFARRPSRRRARRANGSGRRAGRRGDAPAGSWPCWPR